MSGCYDIARTEVEIMWTNQHGTGQAADHLVNSQVILQYMCQPFPDGESLYLTSTHSLNSTLFEMARRAKHHRLLPRIKRVLKPQRPTEYMNRTISTSRITAVSETKVYKWFVQLYTLKMTSQTVFLLS